MEKEQVDKDNPTLTVISSILGTTTKIKKVKRNSEDHKRIVFNRIIENYIIAVNRESVMDEMYMIDLSMYNQIYWEVIEDALSLCFNAAQIGFINFYLFERFDIPGSIKQLFDENNQMIPLDTPDDLWNLLQNYK